ncbi:MAG: hypothetical protein H7A40_07105 [Chlamydiales bacterium]|nr:hypothetical protein [Chlamydiales bacterium]
MRNFTIVIIGLLVFSSAIFGSDDLLSQQEIGSNYLPMQAVEPAQILPPEPPRPPLVNYELMIDAHMSPKAAAHSLSSIHKGIERMASPVSTKGTDLKARLARILEMSLVWAPINRFTMVVQHEVYGHGYRLRDIGEKKVAIEGYQIDLPPPYGNGGGSTSFRINENLTTPEINSIVIGGMEGSAELAKVVRRQWLENGKVNPRQAFLYLEGNTDLIDYTWSMSGDKLKRAGSGHDAETYLMMLRCQYPGSKLKVQQLKYLSLLGLVDTTTLVSFGSIFGYISQGQDLKMPSKLGNLRMGYAPYGPEFYAEYHQAQNGKPMSCYVKGGKYAGHHSLGLGLDHPHLWSVGAHKWGFQTDLWLHPRLDNAPKLIEDQMFTSSRIDLPTHTIKYQPGLSFVAKYKLHNESEPLGGEIHLGAKTSGYLPGESLKAALILRGALSYRF